jgi:hypothetical protein
MQDLPLPRVTAGTKLYYEVPAHTWTAYEGPSIYDFGGTLFSIISFFYNILQFSMIFENL